MLKVVHEDEHSSATEHAQGLPQNYLNKANNLGSLVSIVSSNSGNNQ
jgi:hypothetical protein